MSLIIQEELGIQYMPCLSQLISKMLPEIHTLEKCDFLKLIVHSQIIYLSVLFFQPVSRADREVIARLRNCVLALAEHKMLLFDTSILYAYEASLKFPVS